MTRWNELPRNTENKIIKSHEGIIYVQIIFLAFTCMIFAQITWRKKLESDYWSLFKKSTPWKLTVMNSVSIHDAYLKRTRGDKGVRKTSSREIKFDRELPTWCLATLISKPEYGFGRSQAKGAHVENSISRIIVLCGPTIELMGRRVRANQPP